MSKKRAVATAQKPQEPIRILQSGVAVKPLIDQIEANPELWNQNLFRSYSPGYSSQNPHAGVADIIVRFNDWKNWKGDRHKFNERHESVWWGPYEKLTYLKPLVFDLMRLYYGEALGMVLITRIPPHTNVKRHVDAGWHAQQYLKFGVSLKAAPGQLFCYDSMKLETQPGDLFAFNNALPHWIENPTDEERWTLIICMRLEQAICRDYKWTGPVADDRGKLN